MFDMEPYYIWHTILSIMLHVTGIFMGLFIWHLFPKNPLKHVTRLPLEKRGLLIELQNEVDDNMNALKEVPLRRNG
uniref:Ni_hydr_CYTB domain-containing protein n=1 Tax=Panagrellus redivivus TaxID=6233 RepID=A0A7E4VAL0_PANRE